MNKNIIDILCCPSCKGELTIEIKKEEKGEIIKGTLFCKKCNCDYCIDDGIPDLLPK